MPQFATAVLTGAAMLIGYKLLQRAKEAAQQAQEARVRAAAARPARRTAEATKDMGALVWDERSGVYRPRG